MSTCCERMNANGAPCSQRATHLHLRQQLCQRHFNVETAPILPVVHDLGMMGEWITYRWEAAQTSPS